MHVLRDEFGTPLFDFHASISKGEIPGYSTFSSIGERDNVSTTATGEDITGATATSLPVPGAGGEQLTIISDDADDTSAGAGVQTVTIDYLDGSGLQQKEVLTMNGTTGVDTVATDITFVNDMYASSVGATGVAEGEIIIYKKGAATTIYNLIQAGGNKSLVINRKVPSNKDLYITGWALGVNGGKLMSARLRSTSSPDGTEVTSAFTFDRVIKTGGDISFYETINPPVKVLSNALVKISAWAEQAGNDVSVSFNGFLMD